MNPTLCCPIPEASLEWKFISAISSPTVQEAFLVFVNWIVDGSPPISTILSGAELLIPILSFPPSTKNINWLLLDSILKSLSALVSLNTALPLQVNVVPLKVRLASASNSVVVEPTVTNSFAVALFSAVIGAVALVIKFESLLNELSPISLNNFLLRVPLSKTASSSEAPTIGSVISVK